MHWTADDLAKFGLADPHAVVRARIASAELPVLRRNIMKALATAAICAAIALPFTAFAQSADTKYCQALSESYRNTIAKTATPNNQVPVAMSKCATAPLEGIPALEKALKDGKVALPPRT